MEKGSSSSSSSSGGGADSLNSLQFGKRIYFEGLRPKNGGSPAKKGRSAVVQGGQPPRCQVEGCEVDLSDAKAYYCRHKVCAMHSKAPRVIVAGIEQRFCQQCSRFHQLPEFDQGKRSCRRRLAGHNERRRKPPSCPLLSSPYAALSPSTFDNHSKTGGMMMDFSSCSTLPRRDSWPNTSARALAQPTTTGKYQLPWQSNPQTPLPDLLQGQMTRPSYSGPGLSSGDCFNGVPNSTSALSLLSTSNTFLGPNGSPLVQPPVDPSAPVGQFDCPSWAFRDNQANSSLHEMPPNMGLARSSDEQYHDMETSGGYDASVLHMNWTL